MTKTNAQKQADWRKRRQDEIHTLRAEVERLRNQVPATPAGPFADCTPEEVEHLKRSLHMHRFAAEQVALANERAAQAKRFKDIGDAAKAKEPLTPEQQQFWRDYHARQKARQEAKDEARERTRPTAGTWWIRTWATGVGGIAEHAEPVEITVGPRGGPTATYAGSSRASKPVFDGGAMRWKIHGRILYATKEEAEGAPSAFEFLRGVAGAPFACKTVKELRQIRSRNHPDKGNPEADPALYQQAVEELDRRRK